MRLCVPSTIAQCAYTPLSRIARFQSEHEPDALINCHYNSPHLIIIIIIIIITAVIITRNPAVAEIAMAYRTALEILGVGSGGSKKKYLEGGWPLIMCRG